MNKSKILSILLGGLYLFGMSGCAPDAETPDPGGDTPVITDEWEQYAEEPVDYTKQSAEAEDESLELWFDHAFAKTPRGVTESSGRDTYNLYMGKTKRKTASFSSPRRRQNSSPCAYPTLPRRAAKRWKLRFSINIIFPCRTGARSRKCLTPSRP